MKDNLEMLMDEIEVITMLNHPNIVNHLETYDDVRYVYIGKFTFLISTSDGVRRRNGVVRQTDKSEKFIL